MKLAPKPELQAHYCLPPSTEFRIIISNIPATLSPTSVGDAHNWRVFIA